MKADQISMKQMMRMLFVALLTPAIHTVPSQPVEQANQAGWLAPLAAFLPLFLMLLVVHLTLQRMPEGTGLCELFRAAAGRIGGKLLSAVYLIWLFVSLALGVRMYGERFMSTTYRDVSTVLFLALLLVVAGWMSAGSLGAVARFGKIAYGAMVTTFAVVLLSALPSMRLDNLQPVWWDDWKAVALGTHPVLTSLQYGFLIYLLLAGQLRREETRLWKTPLKWTAAYCVMLTLVGGIVVACFSTGMVARMKVPFFNLAKEIELFGVIGRTESLVVALWVLTDTTLVALLLKCVCKLLGGVAGTRLEKMGTVPAAVLALPAALVPSKSTLELEEVLKIWNGIYGAALIYLGIPLVCLTVWLRQLWQRKRCVNQGN